MVHGMRATGSMICNMVLAKKFGPMALATRAITAMERSMARELTLGLMAPYTMVTGQRIGLRALVPTFG